MRTVTAVLATTAMLTGGYLVLQGSMPPSEAPAARLVTGNASLIPLAPVAESTTTTTTTTRPTTDMAPTQPPPHGARYVVPMSEAEPEAKQLAVDIAYALTTYEERDDHLGRLRGLADDAGLVNLAQAAEPLIHPGSWSRGEVIYPQLGGLRNQRTSVMVVTRQTVGSGSEAEFTVVRTLDIRLVKVESGWEFDYLSSAGGSFESLEDLATAHAVAHDPRIEMPDSSRLDILDGLISPVLLRVMADIADRTPYGVVVLATGHPHNVFETDRKSHHTSGRAVDIYRVGDRLVIDDRHPDSATRALVEWLYHHRDVHQVGSPWDLDGSSSRSFTDSVHQDHIHLAVKDGH